MRSPKLVISALLFAGFVILLPVHTHAKDEWLQVRSKNFFLVGNASEKEIRHVATKLEQFRETFRRIFRTITVNAPIPTNVVVFKNESAYKPYKPKRADGKIDNFVAGYFQPGEDVNYITLSTDGTDADTFGTIYHEYVHFLIETNFGKSDVPQWFNEGLAEYYQTFEIEEDQKVKLGLPQAFHLQLLRENKLIPLQDLFDTSNAALHAKGNHSRSIFYAQSWAMVHYLILKGKLDHLDKYLNAVLKNVPAPKAFQDAFGVTYAEMEKELRKYVGQGTFQYFSLPLKEKLVFDSQMQTAPLSDAEAKAYLGDLLYHTNRADDAEPLLTAAIAADPNLSMANTTLGMVKIRQRKWDEARTYLEKSLAQDQKNHIACYQYAYLLSREGRDEFGYVRSFPADTAAKMREMLKKAIAINPEFTESYELLAFVNLVNNENLDESIGYLRKALQYQPGNQRYLLRAASIYVRLEKFKEAETIIAKVAETAEDESIRSQAESLKSQMKQMQEIEAHNAAARRQYEEAMKKGGDRPVFVRRTGGRQPTPEELAKYEAEVNMRSINGAIRKPLEGEVRVVGSVQKVACKGADITYSIKTDTEAFELKSKDFQALELNSFVSAANNVDVGCDASLASLRSVITYRPAQNAKTGPRGDMVSLEFVPNDFRFVDPGMFGEAGSQETIIVGSSEMPPDQDLEQARRTAMMEAIKNAIRKPADGERQILGTLDRIECDKKGINVFVRSGSEVVKLVTAAPEKLLLRSFTPDMPGMQFGCGTKGGAEQAVFTFKAPADAKAKSAGEIVSIEYVPKSFVLE